MATSRGGGGGAKLGGIANSVPILFAGPLPLLLLLLVGCFRSLRDVDEDKVLVEWAGVTGGGGGDGVGWRKGGMLDVRLDCVSVIGVILQVLDRKSVV